MASSERPFLSPQPGLGALLLCHQSLSSYHNVLCVGSCFLLQTSYDSVSYFILYHQGTVYSCAGCTLY